MDNDPLKFFGQEASPAIRVRFRYLPESDITMVRGFRCTTLVRTLVDLAEEMPTAEVRRLIRQAIDKKLVTLPELRAAAHSRTDIAGINDFRVALRGLR